MYSHKCRHYQASLCYIGHGLKQFIWLDILIINCTVFSQGHVFKQFRPLIHSLLLVITTTVLPIASLQIDNNILFLSQVAETGGTTGTCPPPSLKWGQCPPFQIQSHANYAYHNRIWCLLHKIIYTVSTSDMNHNTGDVGIQLYD